MKYLVVAGLMLTSCSESGDAAIAEREFEAARSEGAEPVIPVSQLDESELAQIAFPSQEPLRDADGAEWIFRNHEMVSIAEGLALVSEGTLVEPTGSHSTAGRLDVFYFSDPREGLFVKERYPEAVRLGSLGALAEWALSDKFTENPTIYASGGFTGQGITEGCTVLTELTANGPRTIATIPDYYGGTSFDGEDFAIEGKIRSIFKGKGFEVAYSGSETGVLQYRWNGSEFTTDDEAVLSHCGFE
ncbi:hypothetical protein [Qipengyuania sp. JC766]|uniref:hypothetical protein n=1 Tax=Qipengyuania sp. JC766 TaxID=3232139 RepID=UPI0034597CAC